MNYHYSSQFFQMTVRIHPSWYEVLASEFDKPYWSELTAFIKSEYSQYDCFPLGKDIFRAFDMTPFESVKVVILGQDPYHTAYTVESWKLKVSGWESIGDPQRANGMFFSPEQNIIKQYPKCVAMGLSFSVPTGSKPQPSLTNIFKELKDDLGIERTDPDLSDWALQWVLLLNAVLTVRSGEAASHQGKWWEIFTDTIIREVSLRRKGIVFILWGRYAISKSTLIDSSKHLILTSPHPSPFSAYTGFYGSKPFSKANTFLEKNGKIPVEW